MAKGASKGNGRGGGGGLTQQAEQNVKNINGYNVTRSDGVNLDFYFAVNSDGETMVSNTLGGLFEPTPYGWTESEMISRIEQFGGQTKKYTKSQLVSKETERLKDREETNKTLDQSYARNRIGDLVNKAYRNTKKAGRMARRG